MSVTGLGPRVAFLMSYYRSLEQNCADSSVCGCTSCYCRTVISDLVHEISSVCKFVCSHDSIVRIVTGASATVQQIACSSRIADPLLLLILVEPTGSDLKYSALK
jgi:hypothetical protein